MQYGINKPTIQYKKCFLSTLAMFGFLHLTMIACLLLLTSALSAPKPNLLQKDLLKAGGGKKLREGVVARYFDGVQKQGHEQIDKDLRCLWCFEQQEVCYTR
jgi:hypothetical protein